MQDSPIARNGQPNSNCGLPNQLTIGMAMPQDFSKRTQFCACEINRYRRFRLLFCVCGVDSSDENFPISMSTTKSANYRPRSANVEDRIEVEPDQSDNAFPLRLVLYCDWSKIRRAPKTSTGLRIRTTLLQQLFGISEAVRWQ